MANQPINDPVTYSEVLRLLETTDLVHKDTFNPLFARLINNDAFIKAFAEQLANDIFAGGFVVSGMTSSKNAGIATQLDVTSGICYVQQSSGGILRFTPAADDFATADPSTTYYLDFQPDGTYSWGTAHSAQANYIPVAEVLTDVLGQINTVTDKRTLKATNVANELEEHKAEIATETVKGHVELATAAETTTGTDNTRAVHPAGLKVELDKKVPTTRQIATDGTALTGGGDLSANRTITHATGAGYKHIPSGGATGQVIGYGGSSGVGAWVSAPGGANGSFTGDGSTTDRLITVGFTPKFVILEHAPQGVLVRLLTFYDISIGTISFVNNTAPQFTSEPALCIRITTNGFYVVYNSGFADSLNKNGYTHKWTALP